MFHKCIISLQGFASIIYFGVRLLKGRWFHTLDLLQYGLCYSTRIFNLFTRFREIAILKIKLRAWDSKHPLLPSMRLPVGDVFGYNENISSSADITPTRVPLILVLPHLRSSFAGVKNGYHVVDLITEENRSYRSSFSTLRGMDGFKQIFGVLYI
jgi:hypothetical protein